MERTKHNSNGGMTPAQVQTLSAIVQRAAMASQLGLQYAGDRDLYQALGYPITLSYSDYWGRYQRQDIAKAVINRPVAGTWRGPLLLVESEKAADTQFEKAWAELERKFKVKSKLSRVDKLTGIGRYGVLLLGLDDVKEATDLSNPVSEVGKRQLIYIRPFGEDSAKITKFEEDTKNPRFGLPAEYTIQLVEQATTKSITVAVHHSRVVHIVDDPLESEIYGTPRLEAIYNRLMDCDKIVGGDGEMFWRGARPGYQGKVDKDYTMTEATKEDLKDQISEFENNLRRILVNEGVDLTALAQQLSDPEPHFSVQIQCISAETGIPKRVLTGSERGQLASEQDSQEWKEYVQSRRDDHAEPYIVRPFVDRLIELKVLPAPGSNKYIVRWSDLYSLSEKAKVEIGKGRANALREYTYNTIAQMILPPDAFMEMCMGFDPEQITLIQAMRDKSLSEEQLEMMIIESFKKQNQPPVEKEEVEKDETKEE